MGVLLLLLLWLGADVALASPSAEEFQIEQTADAVSYTHLTLPTIYSV